MRSALTKQEFMELKIGDKVRFSRMFDGVKGSGTIRDIRPWSSSPVRIEWFEDCGDKHIECFHYMDFRLISKLEDVT